MSRYGEILAYVKGVAEHGNCLGVLAAGAEKEALGLTGDADVVDFAMTHCRGFIECGEGLTSSSAGGSSGDRLKEACALAKQLLRKLETVTLTREEIRAQCQELVTVFQSK